MQATPVFLPGKSHGQRSLMGCSPWGRKRVGQDLVIKQQQQNSSYLLTRKQYHIPIKLSLRFTEIAMLFFQRSHLGVLYSIRRVGGYFVHLDPNFFG